MTDALPDDLPDDQPDDLSVGPPHRGPVETYTARSPADLLAMVPYLLGFHPRDSLVVLTFGVPGGSFQARVDLATEPSDQEQVAADVLAAVLRNEVPQVALICYSRDAVASQQQCTVLRESLLEAGVEVIDVLRADGERYFHVPELGSAGTSYDLASHPFTAERVYRGDVVLGSREQLADTLAALPDEETHAALGEHVDRIFEAVRGFPGGGMALLRTEARWLQRRIRLHLRDHRPLSSSDAGRMLALACLIEVRDVAWSEMTRATARHHVRLWRDLVRRCPDDVLPPAASLLAFAAWLAGDGALAWCAVDRALGSDPNYSMAHLVADALVGALPPTAWTPVPEGDLPVFAGGG
jgi:hypothetical protein